MAPIPPSTQRPGLGRTFLLIVLALVAAAARAEISDGEIRVGLLLDMKALYSHFSGRGSVVAAQMAIDDVGGKIDGKPIRLVYADHDNDPALAAKIARKWLYEDGVDVIGDVVGSPAALAVQEVNRGTSAVLLFNSVMTSELTGKHCASTGIHWMYDGNAFNVAIGRNLTQSGYKTWYFLTVDNAFGVNVERSLAEIVAANGGAVVGSARHPLGTAELFDRLRLAANSGAQVIALVDAGSDMINAVRQSFDLLRVSKGQTVLAAVASSIDDVHMMTLPLAQGMRLSQSFYWNLDARTRTWSMRFYRLTGSMPSDMQAGVYSSLSHYFKAVAALKSDDGPTVVKKMRELPIDDPAVRHARLRADGRMVHDVYLLRVKKPSESKEPWDYLEVLEVIPGDEAFAPASKDCPLN